MDLDVDCGGGGGVGIGDRRRVSVKRRRSPQLPPKLVDQLRDLQVQVIALNKKSRIQESYTAQVASWLDDERAVQSTALAELEELRTLCSRQQADLERLQLEATDHGVASDLRIRVMELSMQVSALSSWKRAAEERQEALAAAATEATTLRQELETTRAEVDELRERDGCHLEEQLQLTMQLSRTSAQLEAERQQGVAAADELRDARCSEGEWKRAAEECERHMHEMGAAWESRERARPALERLIQVAIALGDRHKDSESLTHRIDYPAWRLSTTCGSGDPFNPELVGGAVLVVETLIPILVDLYAVALSTNDKLRREYDALVDHAKSLESTPTSPQACAECAGLRTRMATLEKEMADAEAVVSRQNALNHDLHARVQHRMVLDMIRLGDKEGTALGEVFQAKTVAIRCRCCCRCSCTERV